MTPRTLLLLAGIAIAAAGCESPAQIDPPPVNDITAAATVTAPTGSFCCDPEAGPDQLVGEVTIRATGAAVNFSFHSASGGIVSASPSLGTLDPGEEAKVRITVNTCDFSTATILVTTEFADREPAEAVVFSSTQTLTVTNTCPEGSFGALVVATPDPDTAPTRLYALDAGMSVPLEIPLPASAGEDVQGLAVTRDGSRAVVGLESGSYVRSMLYVGNHARPWSGYGLQQTGLGDPVELVAADLGHDEVADVQWSPDGTRVSYVLRFHDDHDELHTIRPDGTDRRVVASEPAIHSHSWAPGSDRIAFLVFTPATGQRVLTSAAPDGTLRTQLSQAFSSLTQYGWSPDGAWMAYVAAPGPPFVWDLYGVRADGTGHGKVSGTQTDGSGLQKGFQWSPDGSRLAYVGAENAVLTPELFTVAPDGTGHARASGDIAGTGVTDYAWSPDGSLIAYTADQDPLGRGVELFVSEPDGAGNRKVSGPLTAPGFVGVEILDGFLWAPDGSRLAYLAYQDTADTYELYTSQPDGTGNVQVSRPLVAGGQVDEFAWLLDATTVVYLADAETNGVTELYAALADGASGTKISRPLPAGESVSGFVVDAAPHCPAGAHERRIAYFIGGPPGQTLVMGTLGSDPDCPGAPFDDPGCGWLEQVGIDWGWFAEFRFGAIEPCQ